MTHAIPDFAEGTAGFVVAAGNVDYEYAEQLPAVEQDVATVLDLFGKLGYSSGARLLGHTADGLRAGLADWADRDEVNADVPLVLYYSGHGEFDDSERHYLLCSHGDARRPTASCLATEDLVRIVVQAGITRVLLIVDTCYSAQGVVNTIRQVATSLAGALTATPGADQHRIDAFSVVAAARSLEAARDGAFTHALREAFDDPALGGIRQRRLYLEQLVDRVNETLARIAPEQHATWGTLLGGPGFTLLPNPRFHPDAPPEGTDMAETSARLETAEPSTPEPDLVGRAAALRHLRQWLTDTPAGLARALVLTGPPGVGKSALLSHLHPTAGGTEPVIHARLHARHVLLPSLVGEIARAAGFSSGTGVEALLAELRHRRAPLTVLVDGLDEAGTTRDEDEEPYRIVSDLLRPLAALPCVRLVVATAQRFVAALGPGFTLMDLDAPEWNISADLTPLARRLLRSPDGPDSTSPYTASPDETVDSLAAEIAECADGNFLVARLIARALAHAPASDSHGMPNGGHAVGILATLRWVLWEHLGRVPYAQPLLTALAFSEGEGLPRYSLWSRATTEILDHTVTDDDIDRLLRAASPYVVEALDPYGRSVYRLSHESLAEQLRNMAPPGARAAMTRSLLLTAARHRKDEEDDATEHGADEPRLGLIDWPAVDPYIRDHLATHAAASGDLDPLLLDPLFVLSAHRDWLLHALDAARSGEAQAAAEAYRLYIDALDDGPDARTEAGQLARWARSTGAHVLAERTERRFPDHTDWFRPPPLDPTESHLIISCDEPLTYSVEDHPEGWRLTATTEGPGGFRTSYEITGLRSMGGNGSAYAR